MPSSYGIIIYSEDSLAMRNKSERCCAGILVKVYLDECFLVIISLYLRMGPSMNASIFFGFTLAGWEKISLKSSAMFPYPTVSSAPHSVS